jgi:isopenicillin N synthase-like dioxygenase
VSIAALPAGLPVIDVGGCQRGGVRRGETTSRVGDALSREGFMYVSGHGIEPALLSRSFALMQHFFSLPQKMKQRHAYDIDANFGYQRIAGERLDPRNAADLKESFTMRNALQLADRSELWPAGDFRDVALALYITGLRAAYAILEIVAVHLALPEDFFLTRHRGENVTLRFLHYPTGRAPRTAQLGAGAHTDYGTITVLLQDDVGGLELRDVDGSWRAAPPIADTAVINTGDLMERWTNGMFRSTVHRVRPVAGSRDRYSIALFVDPDTAVEVSCFASCVSATRPLRYGPTTAGEHIRQKIAATQEGLSSG